MPPIPTLFLLIWLLLSLAPLQPVAATSSTTLLPIGAGYEADTLAALATVAAAHDTDDVVTLRVLPITYASNAYNITNGERNSNFNLAQNRAAQLATACQSVKTAVQSCDVAVIDIQIRTDADDATRVAQLDDAVDAIFILGGDQTIAMQVTANTLLEDTLELRYLAGIPIGGTSAGAAVQSRYMIAGYEASSYAWHALEQDALELWYDPFNSDHRGLRFGWQPGVIDQHVLERGRLARLLQATAQLPSGHVGVGVDTATAAEIVDGRWLSTFDGAYAAIVVDLETYGSAGGSAHAGPRQLLRLRDVALHILPPGNITYDLTTRRPDVPQTAPQPAPDIAGRAFADLVAPAGAGPLYITGDLSVDPDGAVTAAFIADAQTRSGPTVVLATGYANANVADRAARLWQRRLQTAGLPSVQHAVLDAGSDLNALGAQLSAAGALFIVADDQAQLPNRIGQLATLDIAGLWGAGRPLLLDNAAAALAGTSFSAAPTPSSASREIQSSDSFKVGEVAIHDGLTLINSAVFEPRLLYDYRYGRLLSHVHAHPTAVAFGIERGSALHITPTGATVLGQGVVLPVDGRYAGTLTTGTNGLIGATWLLLDTYLPGDTLYQPTPTALTTIPLPSPSPTPWPATLTLLLLLTALTTVAVRRREKAGPLNGNAPLPNYQLPITSYP